MNITTKGLPFDIREKCRARDIRRLTSEHRQMINSPRHHHVDSEARLQPVRVAQLPILDTAAALQRPMVQLDAPTSGIPLHSLGSIGEIANLGRGQQHPLNPVGQPFSLLQKIDGPCPDRLVTAGKSFGRRQLHLGIANIRPGIPTLISTAAGDVNHEFACDLLVGHECPQVLFFHLPVSALLHPDQQFGGIRGSGQGEQFIDIRLPIADTDQRRFRTQLLDFRDFIEAAQPFATLFLLDGQRMATGFFALVFRVTGPTLTIEYPQGRAIFGKGQGVVQEQTDGFIGYGKCFCIIFYKIVDTSLPS